MIKQRKSAQTLLGAMLLLAVALVSGYAGQTYAAPSGQVEAGNVSRDVTYCTADGVSLRMDIYMPPASKGPAPVVLYAHGGSWIHGDKWEVGLAGPELASRGYVAASVNYRLAPEYKWPAQIEDVKCAVRYLRAHASTYNLDPNRIGAWGSSAGGHLVALLGLTTQAAGFEGHGGYPEQSSRVQAVVDMFGPTDLTVFNPDDLAKGVGQAVFGVASGQASDVLVRASPVTYVSKSAPPFLILQGDKDTLVPPSQSQELYDKLKAAGAPASLVIVKNAEHGFVPTGGDISPNIAQIKEMITGFFDQNLDNTQETERTFPQTGKTVRGNFLRYWDAHGGLAQQGYPISDEIQEQSATDGKTYTVQYFERAVFEAHPENPPPNDVLLSLLGDQRYRQKYPDGTPGQTPDMASGSVLFKETGHRLGGRFLDYWQQHGGLAQQGYPISDPFTEVSDVDGKPHVVQYFERAVFELHPGNQPPNDVLLSLLGTLHYRANSAP